MNAKSMVMYSTQTRLIFMVDFEFRRWPQRLYYMTLNYLSFIYFVPKDKSDEKKKKRKRRDAVERGTHQSQLTSFLKYAALGLLLSIGASAVVCIYDIDVANIGGTVRFYSHISVRF